MKNIVVKSIALLAALLLAAQVQAATPLTLSFYGITGNDSTGNAVADGVANLKMQVIDIGTG